MPAIAESTIHTSWNQQVMCAGTMQTPTSEMVDFAPFSPCFSPSFCLPFDNQRQFNSQ